MMTEQGNNKTNRQTIFLQRLADAKERLTLSINDLDETALCDKPVVDDWTVKDILGHIVSWNEEFRANIEMILKGKHPGYDHVISGKDNFSSWNQQWIAKKRDYSFDQIMADVERDYQEAVNLIERLDAEEYQMRGITPWKNAAEKRPEELTKDDTDTVETLVTFHWRHMNQHIREIEECREQLESKEQ